MSGQWPPEWEDSDTGLPDEWTVDDAGLDQEATEVTLFLASVPSPVLPASFEARISAAIAAEATARANGTASDGIESTSTGPARMASADAGSAGTEPTGTGSAIIEPVNAGIAAAETDDAETTDRSSPPEFSPAGAESGPATAAKHRRRRTSAASRSAAAKSRPAGSRPDGRRRRFRLPSPAVTGPLLVLAVIAGFAALFTQLGGSSSSSSSGLASGGTSAAGVPSAASGHASSAGGRNAAAAPAGSQFETNQSGLDGRFAVTESGTQYQGSTLASQVREQLVAVKPSAVTPAASASHSDFAVPAASATASTAASAGSTVPASSAPSTKLSGCVSRVTGGVTPRLVDQATYDGIPAYIIAVPSRVWVVKLGCTAADPQEITSVSLTGLFRESQRPRIG